MGLILGLSNENLRNLIWLHQVWGRLSNSKQKIFENPTPRISCVISCFAGAE